MPAELSGVTVKDNTLRSGCERRLYDKAEVTNAKITILFYRGGNRYRRGHDYFDFVTVN